MQKKTHMVSTVKQRIKAASDIPRLSVGNLYVEASMEHGWMQNCHGKVSLVPLSILMVSIVIAGPAILVAASLPISGPVAPVVIVCGICISPLCDIWLMPLPLTAASRLPVVPLTSCFPVGRAFSFSLVGCSSWSSWLARWWSAAWSIGSIVGLCSFSAGPLLVLLFEETRLQDLLGIPMWPGFREILKGGTLHFSQGSLMSGGPLPALLALFGLRIGEAILEILLEFAWVHFGQWTSAELKVELLQFALAPLPCLGAKRLPHLWGCSQESFHFRLGLLEQLLIFCLLLRGSIIVITIVDFRLVKPKVVHLSGRSALRRWCCCAWTESHSSCRHGIVGCWQWRRGLLWCWCLLHQHRRNWFGG